MQGKKDNSGHFSEMGLMEIFAFEFVMCDLTLNATLNYT